MPAARGRGDDQEAILRRLQELLESVSRAEPEGRSQLREEVLRFADITGAVRRLAKLRLRRLTESNAARDRILAYLKLFKGEVVQGRELQVVSGIQEFARRIRELRVQFGYNISTGYSRAGLRPDQYILEVDEPDEQAAEKWDVAHRIRRRTGSARDRILALLTEFVGLPVTGEQISYVAKIREDGRRVRELRRELGYRIVTRHTGRPDLPAGVYVLESGDQLPQHDRHIADATYDAVLARDEYRCKKCGWQVQNRHPAAHRQFLEVHHVEYHQDGGLSNLENLITLCNVDHDTVHRQGLRGAQFFDWVRS